MIDRPSFSITLELIHRRKRALCSSYRRIKVSVFQKESKAARKVECREQGWFKIVREPQFPLNAIKAEASLSGLETKTKVLAFH